LSGGLIPGAGVEGEENQRNWLARLEVLGYLATNPFLRIKTENNMSMKAEKSQRLFGQKETT
jgi:hypothetical protein